MGCHGRLRLLDKGGGGGVALPTAPAAAVAKLAPVADDQMARLTGSRTTVELSAQQQSAANTGPQRHHGKITGALSGAAEKLTHGSTVRVVAQKKGQVQVAAEQLLDGHVLHGNVGGKQNVTAGHGTRQTHAHVFQRLRRHTALVGSGSRQLGHIRRELLGSPEIQGPPLHCQDISRFIHQAGLQVGAAYIDSNIQHMSFLLFNAACCRRPPAGPPGGPAPGRRCIRISGGGCSWRPPPQCWPGSGPAAQGW